MSRLIKILENLLFLDLFIFIASYYYSKTLVKVILGIVMFLFILVNILKAVASHPKTPISVGFLNLLPKSPLNVSLYIFLFATVISTIFSLNPGHSQRVFFERIVPYMLFFILGCFIAQPQFRKKLTILIGLFAFTGLIIGINGALDYFRFPAAKRLYVLFGSPFNFTPFILFYIPISCALAFFAKNKLLKTLGIASIFILFPCLFWNNSRAAWLAIPLALLVIYFLKNKKFALITLIVFSIGFLFSSPSIKTRVGTTFNTLTWGGRVELYQAAVKIFNDFPITGAGLGMYEKLFHFYGQSNFHSEDFIHLHAHSTYLEIAAELGIFGLLAFLAVFIIFFINLGNKQRLWKKYPDDEQAILLGLSAAILASLIVAFATTIITVGVQDPAIFWFLFGIASGLLSVNERKENI